MLMWFDTWFWGSMGIYQIAIIMNVITYLIDYSDNFFGGDPQKWGHYPSMYNNFVAAMFMQDPAFVWGGQMWHDYFTWAGLYKFLIDYVEIKFFWPWALFVALWRAVFDDYDVYQNEWATPIDKNNWAWFDILPADRWDANFWKNQENGSDCNGVIGKGNYCYCPS